MLLLQSLLMLPVSAVSLRTVGFQRWQSALARLTGSRSHPSLSSLQAGLNSQPGEASASSLEINKQRARQIARLVRAAANHGLYRANCLEQSLVLWYLLKRNGLESQIRFGARKEEDQLQAHAWVECGGIALNGVDQRYAPFAAATANTVAESPKREPV